MIKMSGCWFCDKEGGDDYVFDWEFDTPVHLHCIRERLKDPKWVSDQELSEAEIMSYLLRPNEDLIDANGDVVQQIYDRLEVKIPSKKTVPQKVSSRSPKKYYD